MSGATATPRFVPTELDPQRMIATRTLETLRAILRGSGAFASPAAARSPAAVTVDVTAHPILREVGGVARVDPGDGAPVGIARIGRSSFAAFEFGPAGLRELPVDVAPDGHVLRIHRRPSP